MSNRHRGLGRLWLCWMALVYSPERLTAHALDDVTFGLHLDYHVQEHHEVGLNADWERDLSLIKALDPDLLIMHAKGAYGWLLYPSAIGTVAPRLHTDVVEHYRRIAAEIDSSYGIYVSAASDLALRERVPAWAAPITRTEVRPAAHVIRSSLKLAEAYHPAHYAELYERYQPGAFYLDALGFSQHLEYDAETAAAFFADTSVDPQTALPTQPDQPHWSLWKAWHRQRQLDLIDLHLQAIAEHAPGAAPLVNLAYTAYMPEPVPEGIAHLIRDIGNRVQSIATEAKWMEATGLPFFILTRTFEWEPKRGQHTKPAIQLEQEIAQVIAHGGRYIAWDRPTISGALNTRRLEALTHVVQTFLRPRERWIGWGRSLADLHVLHAPEDQYARWEPTSRLFGPARHLEPLHDALVAEGLLYRFVGPHDLPFGADRSVPLLVDNPQTLSLETLRRLRLFSALGGTVILTGSAWELPETMDWIGAGRTGIVHDGNGRIEGPDARVPGPIYGLKASDAEPLLTAHARGASLPLLLSRPFFEGRITYVATGLTQGGAGGDDARRLLFASLIPPAQRHCRIEQPPWIEVVLRAEGDQLVLHRLNRHTGTRRAFQGRGPIVLALPEMPEAQARIRLQREPVSVTLEPEGTPVEGWTYADGFLQLRLPQAAVHQIIAIELQAAPPVEVPQ